MSKHPILLGSFQASLSSMYTENEGIIDLTLRHDSFQKLKVGDYVIISYIDSAGGNQEALNQLLASDDGVVLVSIYAIDGSQELTPTEISLARLNCWPPNNTGFLGRIITVVRLKQETTKVGGVIHVYEQVRRPAPGSNFEMSSPKKLYQLQSSYFGTTCLIDVDLVE